MLRFLLFRRSSSVLIRVSEGRSSSSAHANSHSLTVEGTGGSALGSCNYGSSEKLPMVEMTPCLCVPARISTARWLGWQMLGVATWDIALLVLSWEEWWRVCRRKVRLVSKRSNVRFILTLRSLSFFDRALVLCPSGTFKIQAGYWPNKEQSPSLGVLRFSKGRERQFESCFFA